MVFLIKASGPQTESNQTSKEQEQDKAHIVPLSIYHHVARSKTIPEYDNPNQTGDDSNIITQMSMGHILTSMKAVHTYNRFTAQPHSHTSTTTKTVQKSCMQ